MLEADLAETDGAGNTWSYAYNSQGLLSGSTDPLAHSTTLTYDREGRLLTSSVPGTSYLENTYTAFGQQDTKSFSDGQGGTSTETYAYDSYGRLTGVASPADVSLAFSSFDAANRPGSLGYELGEGNNYSESLTYTDSGALASITLPQGVTDYAYNQEGRLSEVSSSEGLCTYSYDEKGLPERVTLPGGAHMDYAYYQDGRPASVTLVNDEGVTSGSVALTFDAQGQGGYPLSGYRGRCRLGHLRLHL